VSKRRSRGDTEDRPKIRKTLATLTELADTRYDGNLVIRKGPAGWIVYFAGPKTLQADMGDKPLSSFHAAAGRAIGNAIKRMSDESPEKRQTE
jgi:hypothetical protein